MGKRKAGGSRDRRRHGGQRQGLFSLPQLHANDLEVVYQVCYDPACLHGIHQTELATDQPSSKRDEVGASNADPIAYHTDYDSEGGSIGQGTGGK